MGGTDFPIPDVADIRLMDVLRTLSDPGRVLMLTVLSDGEFHPCTPDAFGLDLQKSTLSHHLKTMREAGLTVTRVTGRNYGVRLRVDDLESRFPGLIDSLTSPAALADLRQQLGD